MISTGLLFAICSALLVQIEGAAPLSRDNELKFEGIDPAAFVTIGNHSYYISPNENFVTVLEAIRFCNDVGMSLLSLETAAKTAEMYDYLRDNAHGLQYWTSGRKLVDTWQWTGNGQLFSYTDWGTDQPNRQETDACVFFDNVAHWDDESCTGLRKRFICQ